MNEIAGDICLGDVSMLADKGELLQQVNFIKVAMFTPRESHT